MVTLTADAPTELARRTATWQQALSRALARVEVTCAGFPAREPSLTVRRLGCLHVVDEVSGPGAVRRSAACVTADPRRHVLVRLQLDGAVRVSQDGRSAEPAAGSLVFLDLGRPFGITVPGPQQARTLVLPRPLLGLDESVLRALTAHRIDPDQGGASELLLPLLAGIGREIAGMAPPAQDRLARSAAELVAALAVEQAGRFAPEAPSATQSLFERVTASVEASLGDPDLTPQAIADQHGVSLRYLHQLFQRQGVTVSRWIRSRRLVGAHQELARPDAARREISAVGARWGFTSASHFSRAFRETYGMSPLQWRTSCRATAARREAHSA